MVHLSLGLASAHGTQEGWLLETLWGFPEAKYSHRGRCLSLLLGKCSYIYFSEMRILYQTGTLAHQIGKVKTKALLTIVPSL